MRPIVRRTLQASAVLFFTLQAIRAFLAGLFGQVYNAFFEGQGLAALSLSAFLILVILLLPLFSIWLSRKTRRNLYISALLCALARLFMSWPDPTVRLISAGLTLAFSGLYIAGLQSVHRQQMLSGLILASIADQILRALGYTLDPSLQLGWVPVQIALIALLAWITFGLASSEETSSSQSAFGLWSGLAYGSILFVLSSILILPNAASRWTELSYVFWVLVMLAVPFLRLWSPISLWLARHLRLHSRLTRIILLIFGLSGLVMADRLTELPAAIGMFLTLIAFWSLLPGSLRLRSGDTPWSTSAGLLLFMILSAAHALSYTYAYTLESFRGAGLPIFLIAMIIAVAPSIAARTQTLLSPLVLSPSRSTLTLYVLTLTGLGFYARMPELPLVPSTQELRLGTYNIHYGYDQDWHLTLQDQARTIAESGADIIALQEVDTGRLTSYGVDQAYWLSQRLGMDVIYLPTVEHTTGIALLSRLEVQETLSALLPSQAEPTGIIRAVVLVGGQPVATHGIWLGLTPEERATQLAAALKVIGAGPATLAGDLNAPPGSPTYKTLNAYGFIDPFATAPHASTWTAPAREPRERIDYIWIRGLESNFALVLDSIASDHRMVVVKAE